MDSKTNSRTSLFEYFLYSAIILETALAAFVYKVIFGGTDLLALNISLTVIYFGFLAWAIIQLNQLHRKRKLQESEPSEPQSVSMSEMAMAVTENGDSDRRILGLTAPQVAVVLIVFAGAVASFSWALNIMHPAK